MLGSRTKKEVNQMTKTTSVTGLRLVPKGVATVKELSVQYGISKSTLYEMIKSDPRFPYKNVGVRKKFMIDVAKFESWLEDRTEKQKCEHFGLSMATELLGKYRK